MTSPRPGRSRTPGPERCPRSSRPGCGEDLRRRDFTVNALALALGGERAGELASVPKALEDLDAGLLRVLHERSFLDDPTRLLRLARYAARLGFTVDSRTLALARDAVNVAAPGNGERVAPGRRTAAARP